MSTSNKATVPKMTDSLHNMWSMLVVCPIYLAISAAAPFSEQIILSQTTTYGKWSLTHWTSWYHCSRDTSVFSGVALLLKVLVWGVPIHSPAVSMLRSWPTSELSWGGLMGCSVGLPYLYSLSHLESTSPSSIMASLLPPGILGFPQHNPVGVQTLPVGCFGLESL